ncbi:hypothetical protein COX86_01970 [Candidatus Micrarchaeota archaeon CG_4_10_14_0_2_um_filter_60_11]|nr:MAG: hypothetical protein AUJ16_04555 [Candidatus Micrarchaeota archaeon CG1_02_60_51]PIN96383.1 MAG: hypothetical protein COU39_01385 [Candidatus Micrarchaeota archaeon CG10_big_fil_rev_8_21_14_0_10_60_32]PIO02045.1 MAG: hypothetical protein COT58_01955 [Candidatus Micrarchaeota archaeon CG09_land_8_20_14_0_10_60_16]PIY91798.1 MAG: hypothetical protein COY71_01200 [Candidatus Micrarchaeota archaeon CG_4_10_14_0_8_um_filter_60_7]PIZ90995.1 MAG: hypothetical protein COX86_01970 [Candidatus Mi
MKGQLYSLDLLVGIALSITVFAVALHSIELVQRGHPAFSTDSQALAEAIASNAALNASAANCTTYSNGSNYCNGFSCANSQVFVTRRIVACPAGPCVLEVRSC